ncbi:MAG TPA: efflux RND transporter periplasmic adaptor subunit [Ramlibacter sp.]|nr:efflux RND transporter periplasmic adaptor subunit [Ramlibacter sp.]
MEVSRPGALALALAVASLAAGAAHAGEFDCVIEPRRVIELRAPLEGLIERIAVDRGDTVRRGQELVVLDTAVDRASAAIAQHRSTMEGAIRSGESRVEFSAGKLARAQALQAQNYVSAQSREEAATEQRLAQSELQDARDNRRLAQLEFARQQEIIRQKTIVSPLDGIVVERLLHPGEFAEAGVGRKPILKLAEIDVLHVEVLLPVEAYGRVAAGLEVAVLPEIPAGARYTGRVRVIDRLVDAASGTFGVRVELPNPQRRMPAGIRCRAEFPGIDNKAVRSNRKHGG